MKLANSLNYMCGSLLVCVALTGCQTAASRVDHRPRFYQSASADIILKFNRWDTIHLLRPEIREGGFLPILTRADLEHRLATQRVGRDLAVVVLGFLFPPHVEARYAREWDALLSAQGFRRVVVLRIGAGRTIDGLLLVHDSSIGGAHDQTAFVPASPPALPAPAGANAANPPGR